MFGCHCDIIWLVYSWRLHNVGIYIFFPQQFFKFRNPLSFRRLKKAEQNLAKNNVDHEYAPIAGNPEFTKLSAALALCANPNETAPSSVATVQSISGTGALRIGAAFLNAFHTGNKEVYLPSPSWGNHNPIFKHSGLKVNTYRYYEPKTCGFDFQGALEDISVSWIFS